MAATHTTNLGLNKPARQDLVKVVTDINDNMDKIDQAVGALPVGKTLQGQITENNQAITQGNFGTKYLNDTSKTAITLLTNDFANLAQRDIQFYSVRPSDDNLYGWMIKMNDTYGYGVFSGPNEGDIIQITNKNGTWSKYSVSSNLTNVQNATASENVTINSGKYLKIGRLVVFTFSFTLSATKNENTILLTGMPSTICDNIPFIASPTTNISTLKNTLSCRMASSNFYTNEQFPATSYTVTGSYISSF